MYERLAESLLLLEHGPPLGEARLSRRTRHFPLGVDREGDVAATMFLRRSVNGIPEIDVHSLELVGGVWRLLGGSGGPGHEVQERRPPLAELGAPAVSHGGGGTARSGPLGWERPRWVRWAELRCAVEVATLQVGDRRVPVPAHGMALVVWTTERPRISALDASGAALGEVVVPPDRLALPEVYGGG